MNLSIVRIINFAFSNIQLLEYGRTETYFTDNNQGEAYLSPN